MALAQDAIDLADRLSLDRFAVIGHDWGARVAYTLATLFPERITSIAALALAYQPRGVFDLPGFAQSRSFWYQWFMCLDRGAEAVRRDPVGFARIQWEPGVLRDGLMTPNLRPPLVAEAILCHFRQNQAGHDKYLPAFEAWFFRLLSEPICV